MIAKRNTRLLLFIVISLLIIIIVSFSIYVLYTSNRSQDQREQENIEFEGTVNYVVDGDTLDINDNRIRLSLVNTPERGQEGYMEAKKLVQNLCLNKKGEVDIDDGQRRGDRYGREVGIVYCDGINLNKVLIENNLAVIYSEYCEISEFSNEEWAKPYCH
ncbi:MAG TPA: thermonuclease family protein [Nitrososphaeraceae archaeon]|nr:thermonuclease family protein [Nitrososphaeraceae archaeon]